MEKLAWKNLKDNRCPKCKHALERRAGDGDYVVCSVLSCEFKITPERFKELVEELYHPGRRGARAQHEVEEKNMERLNNLSLDPFEGERPEGDTSILY